MDTEHKNDVLLSLSKSLRQNISVIIEANLRDMATFPEMDDAMKDRLKVDEKKIEGMITALKEVAALPDPEGRILYERVREDGLYFVNRTVPFGTILIIYESRPDVTIEAAATAFKAGNRILLKGGKESYHTNRLLVDLWQQALFENGSDKGYVTYLNLSREETQALIRSDNRSIDLIIPRGGEGLIRFVREHASVPVIVSGRGNNFLYVDADADFEMAIRLIVNGKRRISVCNATDKVLIHKEIKGVEKKLHQLVTHLIGQGITVCGDRETASLCAMIRMEEGEATLYEEYLAAKIYVTLVDNLAEAVKMINRYSGRHTAVIVTNDPKKAAQFMQEVDCAAVNHNASSRFTDGGQYGVGAEIAISTQKLHFRGPLGTGELVTNKWFIYGKGAIRE